MFFIMYYKDVENIKLIEISRKSLRENSDKSSFNLIFLFFFEYAFIIPENFNLLITEWIPNLTKKIVHPAISFTMLFILLVFFFKNFAVFLKDFLINILTKDLSQNILYWLTFSVLMIYFIGDFATTVNEMYKNSSILGFDKIGAIIFLITTILKAFLCVYLIGVPTSIFFVVGYILIYTFFAIFFYRGFDLSIFKNIDEYVRMSPIANVENICDEPDFITRFLGTEIGKNFNTVIYLLKLFVMTIQSKLFFISFIMLFIVCCIDYSQGLKNNPIKGRGISNDSGNLKNSLLFINICIIVVLSSIVMKYFLKEYGNFNV